MTKFRLSIANTVGVLVKGKYHDENGAEQPFEFTLFCDRLSNEEMLALPSRYATAFDFLRAHAKGWKDQQLVVDEANQPAAFSPEALDVLLSMTGMAAACYQAYRVQATATLKN